MSDDFQMKLLPKQMRCFTSKADVVLYGGAAGASKSACLMLLAIYHAYNQPNLQIYLFRKTYPEINSTFMTGEFSFPMLLLPYINEGFVKINSSKMQIEFSNGAIIHLCHCANENDMFKYQGASMGMLLIDEAGAFSETVYRYLKSRVRIAHEVRPEFKQTLPKVVLTANPDGPLMSFLKNNFVNFCKQNKVTVYNEEYRETREYIPATLQDNPYLRDTDYAEKLKSLGSPALVKAYLNGDWSVALNNFFDGCFTDANIVQTPFPIPSSWTIKRGFDYGYSAPYSVLWIAESNGENITHNGQTITTVRGDRFVFMELYGDNNGDEKGRKQTAEEIAIEIKKYEASAKGSIFKGMVSIGEADSAIFSRESNGSSVANNMRKMGVTFLPCKKGAGSRVLGWQTLISLFKNGTEERRERPGLFVFSSCPRLIDHIKIIGRDPKKLDDVLTTANDHDLDCLRYLCSATKQAISARQF